MTHISTYLNPILSQFKPSTPMLSDELLEKSAYASTLRFQGAWTGRDDARQGYEKIRPLFKDSVDFRMYCIMSGHYNIPMTPATAQDWLTSPEPEPEPEPID